MLPTQRNIQSCNIMILIRRIVEFPLSSQILIISFELSSHKPPSQYSSIGSGFNHSQARPSLIAIKSMQPWLPGSFIETVQLIFHKKLMRATTWCAWSLQDLCPANISQLQLFPADKAGRLDWAGFDWQSLPDLILCYLRLPWSPFIMSCDVSNIIIIPLPPPVISYYHYQPHNCHTRHPA